jgi:hypothetical protein
MLAGSSAGTTGANYFEGNFGAERRSSFPRALGRRFRIIWKLLAGGEGSEHFLFRPWHRTYGRALIHLAVFGITLSQSMRKRASLQTS